MSKDPIAQVGFIVFVLIPLVTIFNWVNQLRRRFGGQADE